MKLKNTLILLSNLLFINNVYAISDDAHICNKAYEKGDYALAASAAKKALAIQSEDREALMCQGRTFSAQGDLNSALTAFKAAEKLCKDALDRTAVALITAHAYKNAQQYEEAVESYKKSLEQATLARSKPLARASHVGIANAYFGAKNYQAALDEYLITHKLDSNDNERGETYQKIALIYHLQNKHELAVEYQVKAFFMFDKVGTMDEYADTSVELGRYYLLANNYPSAENTLNKIIKIANEQGGPYYEAKGLYLLALTKARAGDMASAKTLLVKAQAIAQNLNDAELIEEIQRETAQVIK